MYQLVLLLAAAALVCEGRNLRDDSAIKKRMNLLDDMGNHIERKAVSSRVSALKKLEALLKQPPAITTIETGHTLEIKCNALAAPAPSIHWFKNDAPVYQHDLESNEIIDSNPDSLARITSTLLVPRTADTAKYTCLVVAGTKPSRASSVVVHSTPGITDLTERSKLVPLAPRILVSYRVFVDNIGTTAVLPCRMRGHPRPQAVWFYKNNTKTELGPRMKVLKSGELVISPLSWEDLGEYVCLASNMFGTATATTFIYPTQPSNTKG